MKNSLNALSPLDGRYFEKVRDIAKCFSEKRIIKERTKVEIEYFIALAEMGLSQLQGINKSDFEKLRKIYDEMNDADAEKIKEIEKTTNHDVKSVEYFLREKFRELNLNEYLEFIHFGLTSQDINNVVFPLMMKESTELYMIPGYNSVVTLLKKLSDTCKNIVMLARTHGQPASPTNLSKEINVFIKRLQLQIKELKRLPYCAKFGGATGNFNAHYIAFPEIDWHNFAEKFINEKFGLKRSFPTTQIEHYDYIAAWCHAFIRINTILIDLCRDFWTYISMDYFIQKINEKEVGSSTMPHKVNPIDFENAEGNLMLANSIFGFMAEKLPISRLQRDLTDSTVMRNLGVPLGHSYIAIDSIKKGILKLKPNKEKIKQDLKEHPEILAEAIQTILRREKYPNAYDFIKKITRTNKKITLDILRKKIAELDIDQKIKNELLNITPLNYTGK